MTASAAPAAGPAGGGAGNPGSAPSPASPGPGSTPPTETASNPPASPGNGPSNPSTPTSTPQPPTEVIIANGPTEGFGPIDGPVTVVPGGILAPGASPGELTILDDFNLFGGVLEIDVWGLIPGDEYDVMTISGSANFESGDIQFVFTNDHSGEIFAPEVGNTFTFLTAAGGIFDFDNNPDLFLFSLDLASTLDFVVNNDGYSLTLEIISALGDIVPASTSNGPPIQTAAVSAPGTLALQIAGLTLLLGAMATRRRRSNAGETA